MDVSTLMKLVLSSNSTGALGKLSGASADQVTAVLNSVMPQLLNGASAQATGTDTAASFNKAIEKHGKADTKDLSAFLGNVDTADGAKILQHLLGGNLSSVTNSAAQQSGLDAKAVMKILTVVAPLLLTILGQQKAKHGDSGSELLVSLLKGTAGKAIGGNLLGVLGKLMK